MREVVFFFFCENVGHPELPGVVFEPIFTTVSVVVMRDSVLYVVPRDLYV